MKSKAVQKKFSELIMTQGRRRAQFVVAGGALLVSVLLFANSPAAVQAQSTKGGAAPATSSVANNQRAAQNSYQPAASPVSQLRQQQQQQQQTYAATPAAGTKRRQPQQSQQQQQQYAQKQEASTEDPLADSEPALYGSVAGKPGVDFPGYTRIPKTSFTCEGKGFDFGFYADEEAGCQVYHVCWSGRRESFLCGVGTVFNQAILACDYWHSVDCSKSSQFYGVNSELGKAGAEPAAGGSQRITPATRPQAALLPPAPSSAQASYGDNLNQTPKRVVSQTSQQQYSTNDDAYFDQPQQQQQQQALELPTPPQQIASSYGATKGALETPQQPATNSYNTAATFAPFKTTDYQQPQQQQQQRRVSLLADTKTARNQQPAPAASPTTLATPAANAKRGRFNMDFNQKVNSLIESPVRPPIKSAALPVQVSAPVKQAARQPQRANNYAQLAVNRAQQSGSQTLNSARKSAPTPNLPTNNLLASPVSSYQQQQQQRQSTFDAELDEPQQQQQQQQQSFDDSPVQTSTAQSALGYPGSQLARASQSFHSQVPQAQQLVVQAGGSGDGSSAITTQYDTISAPANGPQQQQQQQQQQQIGGRQDQSYDSQLDDSQLNSSEDFKSAAAASHNQNWYIMRSI